MKCASAFTALAACMIAAPAVASVHIATYRAKLYSGYDATGVFGARNADLAGANVTAVFTYDTALGVTPVSTTTDARDGGSDIGAVNPVTHVAITINGRGYAFAPNTRSQVFAIDAGGSLAHGLSRIDATEYSYINASRMLTENFADGFCNFQSTPAHTKDVTAAIPLTGCRGSLAYTFLFQIKEGPDYALDSNAGGIAIFNPGSFTVTGGVPEPAGWTLLIGGFGLVGATTRRRRWITVRPRTFQAGLRPTDCREP